MERKCYAVLKLAKRYDPGGSKAFFSVISLCFDDKGEAARALINIFPVFSYRVAAFLYQCKVIPLICLVFISLWIIKCCYILLPAVSSSTADLISVHVLPQIV